MNNYHIKITSYHRLNITLSHPVYRTDMEYKGQINIYGCINKGKTIKNKRIKAGTT